jgi:hypothetical protein
MFLDSDTYDWTQTEDDVELIKDIIFMAALMAIYEITDAGCIPKANFDSILSCLIVSDWTLSIDNLLFQALTLLSRDFETSHANSSLDQEPNSQDMGQGWRQDARRKFRESDAIGNQPWPKYPGLPLDPDRHELRLLELLPGLKGQPIRCLLSITSLENAPEYEALSYVWGSPTPRKSILLNEIGFVITPNLEIALRHFRDQEETRTMWINALCIN